MSTEITSTAENHEPPLQLTTYFAQLGENPALTRVPVLKTSAQAAAAAQFLPDLSPGGDISADDRILIPTSVHRRLFLDLAQSVTASAIERDLSNPGYRAKVITAHRFINHRRDTHGHSVFSTDVAIPKVSTKVHFAVVPNGVGQHALINACQRVFQTENMLFEVPLEGRPRGIRFARMDTVVVPFPPNGSPGTFGRALVKQVSPIFDARHALQAMRDDEVATAVQSLLLSLNVGLVVVGPVSNHMSKSRRAAEMWSMLGQVATATGIPFVIVGTPGAALNLLEQGDAEAALTSRGVYCIEPFSLTSGMWMNTAQMVWLKYLIAAGKTPPPWFSAALHAVTLGRIELAVKVGAFIASTWLGGAKVVLSKEIFIAYAHQALQLQQPMLDAVRRARAGGTFTLGRIRWYSDWLLLSTVVHSLLRLDDGNDFSQTRAIKAAANIVNTLRAGPNRKVHLPSEHTDEKPEEAEA
ncbi:hypothetical protein C7405_11522 [Paraburkholderia caballeronis]|uniref:hypothetical protein n=1 Tax=Paraburkholderia caballeronis TaxID=416943 RepID=UPI001065BF0A|nr:hypothetical protein [Paraburkholderia caballeronis]TDV27876.1 hypothetical protein C7405_11522 [Paraburkholderia caballeronis]